MSGGQESGGEADFALVAHNSWSIAKQDGAVNPKLILTAAPETLMHAYVPDLHSAKLRLVHSAILDGRTGPAMIAGYAGSRGCRVTLLVTASGLEMRSGLEFRETAGVIRALWRAGSLNYVMLAKGMAHERFRLLASSVSKSSLDAVPLDTPTQVALARSRSESKPCAVT